MGEVAALLPALRREASGGPVALGLDLPLGVPRAYARRRPEPDFPCFLAGRAGDFFRVCKDLQEISAERPFYPARGLAGMRRAAHAAALGLAEARDLSRWCDRATAERPAGAPVFWTLGANQSGKAAIAGWRDLLIPHLGEALHLWPFAGAFRGLPRAGHVAVAEVYPAEALRHFNLKLQGSKRRQGDRVRLGPALEAVFTPLGLKPAPALHAAMRDGFGADAAGEDRFDSVLGVLCLLNVLAGNRPDTAPADDWVCRWEGWVLGQSSLPEGAVPSWSAIDEGQGGIIAP